MREQSVHNNIIYREAEFGMEDMRSPGKWAEHLKCPICHNICRDPIVCKTYNIKYCEECISTHLEIRYNCPLCRTPWEEEKLDPTIRGIIQEIEVKCKFPGCDSIQTIGQMQEHMLTCQHRTRSCQGCGFEATKQQKAKLFAHLKLCPNMKWTCPYSTLGCPLILGYKEIHQHYKECPYAPRICRGCNQYFRWEERSFHKRECPMRSTKCCDCGHQLTSQLHKCGRVLIDLEADTETFSTNIWTSVKYIYIYIYRQQHKQKLQIHS